MSAIKVVIVGDRGVGKQSLAISTTTNSFPGEYIPKVFDNYSAIVKSGHQSFNIGLWTISGQEDYDRLRPLAYANTDVFLICFSLVDPASYESVVANWYPELMQYCPNASILLIGTKSDCRNDATIVASLRAKGQQVIATSKGTKLASNLNAFGYIECSAVTQENLRKVLDETIAAFLSKSKKNKVTSPTQKLVVSDEKEVLAAINDKSKFILSEATIEIDLSEAKLEQEGLRCLLESIQSHARLTKLNLSENHIGTKGAKYLSEYLNENTTLVSLNLRGCHIGSEAKRIADFLETNTSLNELNLAYNLIGPKEIKRLSKSLRVNSSLTRCLLDHNSIGSDGARYLLESLDTNKSLTHLNLEGNNIEDSLLSSINAKLKLNKAKTEVTVPSVNLKDSTIVPKKPPALHNNSLSNTRIVASASAIVYSFVRFTTGNSAWKQIAGLNDAAEVRIYQNVAGNYKLVVYSESTGKVLVNEWMNTKHKYTEDPVQSNLYKYEIDSLSASKSYGWTFLNNNEKILFEQQMQSALRQAKPCEIPLTLADATVYVYNPSGKNWKQADSNLSRVGIYHDTATGNYRIVALDAKDRSPTANSAIFKELNYQQASDVFHQWTDPYNAFGLKFTTKADADNFAKTIRDCIAKLRGPTLAKKVEVIQNDLATPLVHPNRSRSLTHELNALTFQEIPAQESSKPRHYKREDPDQLLKIIHSSPTLIKVKERMQLKPDSRGRLILGKGGFGAVFLVEVNKTLAALKEIVPDKMYEENIVESFKQELALLMDLRHPHIVSFLGGSTTKDKMFFLTEFMEHGDLYGLIATKDPLISWNKNGKDIALNIALGLNHLHQNNIVHRDVKSLNVLIGKGYVAKIADFGLAKIKTQTATHTIGLGAVSFPWASPEQLDRNQTVSFPSDIFSFGVVLWELITQQRPYPGLDQRQLMMSIIQKEPIESLNVIPSTCPPRIAQLIRSCWNYDPKMRPSAEQCIDILSQH